MTEVVPVVPGEGNTISSPSSDTSENSASETSSPIRKSSKRTNPAKRWCFTLNNYTEEEVGAIGSRFKEFQWIMGYEVGESGTPHLQGYVEFPTKIRPLSLGLSKRIHWEVARCDRSVNIRYCSKAGNVVPGSTLRAPRELPVIELWGWQLKVRDIMQSEPDNRSIYWFWEPNGNVGKSALVRWAVQNLRTVICSGKASDIKYSIVKYNEKNGYYPDVVIFDIPRESLQYVSYTGLEEVKNGCFASSKYECGMVIMPYAHVIIFANEPPRMEKLSEDRWKVAEIRVTGEIEEDD